ncbi:MAG TPA: hypothetical protein QF469_01160 [Sphingomonas sanguinis]|uniref:hypothetical protein n=1 Tax=Sphingomonas sanguinis TaxID=33051 RepID=UPI002AC12A98|nr:hypothetical protein [Sphingomonas sanguinis]
MSRAQPVPFDDRYWGSSWYDSLGFVYGLEEVYKTGIGNSRDSARHSVNIVQGDSYLPFASRNAERNMVIGKARYVLASTPRGQLSVTGPA